jgi:hypothetical protein
MKRSLPKVLAQKMQLQALRIESVTFEAGSRGGPDR